MSPNTLFLLLATTASALAQPTIPATMSIDGVEVRDLGCSLLEGTAEAEGAIEGTLTGRHAALSACVEQPAEVRVQWSWGGDKGATIVVTQAPSEALADCVEDALVPAVNPHIVGYCIGHVPLEPPVVTADAGEAER